MTFRIHPTESAYASTVVDNLPFILENGFPCLGRTSAEPQWVELQDQAFVQKMLARRLDQLPGAPSVGEFAFARFSTLTPSLYNVATGTGAVYRPNSEVVHIKVDIGALRSKGIRVIVTDRNVISPNVIISSDLEAVKSIDVEFLRKRDFRSLEKARFDAGVLVLDAIPLDVMSEMICSDYAARDRVQMIVDRSTAKLPVVADAFAFMRNKSPP